MQKSLEHESTRKVDRKDTAKPKDFEWSELERLLEGFGYRVQNGEGSRRRFTHAETNAVISLHEPHPGKILKAYQVREILVHLKEKGYL